jgi:hypothetical protein
VIEGDSDLKVRQARKELMRILNEETMRVAGSVNAGRTGKYSIV